MLERIRKRQDPHSLYLAAASGLFGLTLVLDLVLRTDVSFTALNWSLLAVVSTVFITVLSLGSQFPPSVGLMCVAPFVLVSLLFLSPLGEEQLAVSSAQELPIAALYLGWFVPRPLGRWLMIIIIVLLSVVMALNPLFQADGSLGVPTAVQLIIVNLLCFEVGSILWRQSERRMSTDSLTGAVSRKAFMEQVTQHLAQTQQDSRPRTLVLIDFDGFKTLNDLKGHAQGDAVLVSSVAAWKAELRKTDSVGRIGGDEFAVLLDGSELSDSAQSVERLRAVSPHPWSWGMAQFEPDDSVHSLFARADSDLYKAKTVRQ